MQSFFMRTTKTLVNLRGGAGWSESLLDAHVSRYVYLVAAHLFLCISGAIRDSTGIYVATYHMLGCILFIGAAMAFSLPYVDKYVKNNAENVKS